MSTTGKHPFDRFDRSWIISLATRTDRRQRVAKQLARIGWPLKEGYVEFFDGIRPTDAGGFPNIGARGCFLSHLEVLRLALKHGCKSVLVLEDDAVFPDHFKSAAPAIFQALESQPWDIAYTGHQEELPPPPPGNGGGEPVVLWKKPVMLTHCYAVQGPAIGRLVAFLDGVLTRPPGHPDGGPMYPDAALNTFRAQNPDIITLMARPTLCEQGGSPSDIQTPKWFDRTPVLRQAVQFVRDLRQPRA